MTTKLTTALRSRAASITCLVFALLALLPAEALAYPPNPC